MANKFQVEIQETVEELAHRLERASTGTSKEKLLLSSRTKVIGTVLTFVKRMGQAISWTKSSKN